MIDVSDSSRLREAIELLYFGYRAFTDQADRILEDQGLGRVHHRILYFIGRRPQMSVSGLLDVLGVTKQALNAPLRRLIDLGLVRATIAAEDRRIRQLCLTEQGQALEALLSGLQIQLLEAAFSRAGPAATTGWADVMAHLGTITPPVASGTEQDS
jgi:DNA-binding MarR family transcriptional regulator